MGGGNALDLANNPPTVVMMVGLRARAKRRTSPSSPASAPAGPAPAARRLRRTVPRPSRSFRSSAHSSACPCSKMGQIDPVTIAVEAVKYAKDHGNDIVFLDTAGRLHIDEQLMDELSASRRR